MIASLLVLIAIIDIAVLAKLVYAFRLLQFPKTEDKDGQELPTVSICIAARNETHAMTQCLERVVASEYPKLEVIVLDDGSRDDTSILIKSFAHSGVRFVEGKALPDGWLGKNYAQSLLANEASGKIVFFMDVDTLIERHTVARAVSYMQRTSSKMVSIIPMRDDRWQTSLLFATMRHFWTVLRYRPGSPRAVANAWMVERDALIERFANDTSLPQSMQVETTLAKFFSQTNIFRLVVSNQWLGLRYEKRWSSQVETSIRLLYPQRDKRIGSVLRVVAVLLLALLPYGLAFFAPWSLVVIALQFAVALYYLSHMWARYQIIGALLVPYTLAQELVLLMVSTYKYKFGTITWKGRPIKTN